MPSNGNEDNLLHAIRRRDLIYRLLQGAMIVIVVGGFLITSIIQGQANTRVLDGLRKQNHQLQTAVDDLKADANDKLDQQTRHLQCIAQFFAQPNREDRVIENLNDCLISAAPATNRPSNTPPIAQAPSPQGQPSNAPSGESPPKSPPADPPATPPSLPGSKPIELLGLPICLPILNICVEQ